MGDILVAGLGNILRGDDGFGVEVVRRLAERGEREGVRFVDFGIRGFDLAYALSNGTERAILVDTTSRGGAPGTLYVLEPHEVVASGSIDTHAMDPLRSLELARALGGVPSMLRVVGCEPASFGDDEVPVMGLTPAVDAAVARAIDLVDELVISMSRDEARSDA